MHTYLPKYNYPEWLANVETDTFFGGKWDRKPRVVVSYISITLDQQDEENPEETTEGDKKKRKRKRKRKDKTQVQAMPNIENPDQSIYIRTVLISFVFWRKWE